MATSSFQFEDLDLVGLASKVAGSSSSPAPPSIVSMASDVFAAGLLDPEQFVPSSMTDLFEGALCDDEIPSLLNLSPVDNNNGKAEEDLQLNSGPEEPTKNAEEPTKAVSPDTTVPVTVAPAPEAIASTPASAISASNSKKRESAPKTASKSHKKMKLAVVPRPAGSQMLQAIRPMTSLPSSSEVHDSPMNKDGINTSTAHIKALTGANGAAVCLDAIEKALQQSGNKSDMSTIASVDADGKPLSAEEKAKQSRDRNRQHARNTRVRKKAYVEELKRTLNTLVEERDFLVHQRRIEQQGIAEQKDVRFRVVEDFLNLRGRNEQDPRRWSMILEEGFQLRLPRADVPGVACSSGGNEGTAGNTGPCNNYPLGTRKKVLTGVDEVVEDSKMVNSLLQSLGASSLSVSYQSDRDSFMMENASAVVNWMATSAGAVTKGASAEFSIEGSLRARFNPITNKLMNMEFSF